ncbi:hypothetical protein E7Z59_01285 [Robertkochia marina]|uniref:Rieske domain-containing protein n=1 Tax=Robertkochia marina TaxID=1227945 RepID=A0A4S3M1N0_9FLAO|nr:hypothetical protein [Robertkochia marina]THD68992.1 hypothetical protein E7Z59_01285 [Robertkochia marina]TRZ44815.1 hypothetical protein D3A96_07250 [Robertkochia marina]
MSRLLIIAIFFTVLLSTGCSNNTSERNPYLPEPQFSIDINLNLPQYGSLNTPGSALLIEGGNIGIRGIIVYNQGFGTYLAWEASCPNHIPNSCSTLKVVDGITAVCNCDDYLYSLVNGALLSEFPENQRPYPLLNYRASVQGSVVTVFN